MGNIVKRGASAVLDAAMFTIGLVEGTVRKAGARIMTHRGSTDTAPLSESNGPPQPHSHLRPEPPHRPTPDPYDVGVTTAAGTTGAGPAHNPSTAEADLQQPGTEEIMEPSTTKKIKSETDTLRRAAERDPGS